MARDLAGGRVKFLGSFVDRPPSYGLPEVLFAGRSNVGKSSCINTLLGVHNAARVSKEPGRTRTINLFEVTGRYILVDLPGYGYARVPQEMQESWKGLVETYLSDRPSLKAAVLLLDARRELDEMDQVLIGGLKDLSLPTLLVATKVDKLSRNELKTALSRLHGALGLPPGTVLPFSSHDRTGVDALKRSIQERLSTSPA